MKRISKSALSWLILSLVAIWITAVVSTTASKGDAQLYPQEESQAFRGLVWEHQECSWKSKLERTFFLNKIEHLTVNSPSELAEYFERLCKRHRFDPMFIAALIEVESRFNPHAISPLGAIGLMQVMPRTAAYLLDREGLVYDRATLIQRLKDPFFNLQMGISYLAEMRDRYKGQARYFLAAYNVGPTRIDQEMKGRARIPQGEAYVEAILSDLVSFQQVVPHACIGYSGVRRAFQNI